MKFNLLLIILMLVVVAFADNTLPKMRPLTDRKFERTPQRLQRGKYLSEGVLQCFTCHSERDWSKFGAPPDPKREGAGAVIYDDKDIFLAAPNLTPDKETGAGTW